MPHCEKPPGSGVPTLFQLLPQRRKSEPMKLFATPAKLWSRNENVPWLDVTNSPPKVSGADESKSMKPPLTIMSGPPASVIVPEIPVRTLPTWSADNVPERS